VTGGLGIMKANWKDDNGYSVDADTAVGVSAGVSYTYRFIPNLGVTVDYKFNNYSYNFNYGTVDEFTIGEKTSALGVNLFASF
jgi:hypothetical protein